MRFAHSTENTYIRRRAWSDERYDSVRFVSSWSFFFLFHSFFDDHIRSQIEEDCTLIWRSLYLKINPLIVGTHRQRKWESMGRLVLRLLQVLILLPFDLCNWADAIPFIQQFVEGYTHQSWSHSDVPPWYDRSIELALFLREDLVVMRDGEWRLNKWGKY